MNREIKFRAWDEPQNYMAYQGTPDLETLQSFIYHFGDKKLMQSVGLTDKNNKEIYEGDVIELFWSFTGASYFVTVIWVKELAKWAMAEKNGKGIYHYFGDQNTRYMDIEVTGNIYQNADILTLEK